MDEHGNAPVFGGWRDSHRSRNWDRISAENGVASDRTVTGFLSGLKGSLQNTLLQPNPLHKSRSHHTDMEAPIPSTHEHWQRHIEQQEKQFQRHQRRWQMQQQEMMKQPSDLQEQLSWNRGMRRKGRRIVEKPQWTCLEKLEKTLTIDSAEEEDSAHFGYGDPQQDIQTRDLSGEVEIDHGHRRRARRHSNDQSEHSYRSRERRGQNRTRWEEAEPAWEEEAEEAQQLDAHQQTQQYNKTGRVSSPRFGLPESPTSQESASAPRQSPVFGSRRASPKKDRQPISYMQPWEAGMDSFPPSASTATTLDSPARARSRKDQHHQVHWQQTPWSNGLQSGEEEEGIGPNEPDPAIPRRQWLLNIASGLQRTPRDRLQEEERQVKWRSDLQYQLDEGLREALTQDLLEFQKEAFFGPKGKSAAKPKLQVLEEGVEWSEDTPENVPDEEHASEEASQAGDEEHEEDDCGDAVEGVAQAAQEVVEECDAEAVHQSEDENEREPEEPTEDEELVPDQQDETVQESAVEDEQSEHENAEHEEQASEEQLANTESNQVENTEAQEWDDGEAGAFEESNMEAEATVESSDVEEHQHVLVEKGERTELEEPALAEMVEEGYTDESFPLAEGEDERVPEEELALTETHGDSNNTGEELAVTEAVENAEAAEPEVEDVAELEEEHQGEEEPHAQPDEGAQEQAEDLHESTTDQLTLEAMRALSLGMLNPHAYTEQARPNAPWGAGVTPTTASRLPAPDAFSGPQRIPSLIEPNMLYGWLADSARLQQQLLMQATNALPERVAYLERRTHSSASSVASSVPSDFQWWAPNRAASTTSEVTPQQEEQQSEVADSSEVGGRRDEGTESGSSTSPQRTSMQSSTRRPKLRLTPKVAPKEKAARTLLKEDAQAEALAESSPESGDDDVQAPAYADAKSDEEADSVTSKSTSSKKTTEKARSISVITRPQRELTEDVSAAKEAAAAARAATAAVKTAESAALEAARAAVAAMAALEAHRAAAATTTPAPPTSIPAPAAVAAASQQQVPPTAPAMLVAPTTEATPASLQMRDSEPVSVPPQAHPEHAVPAAAEQAHTAVGATGPAPEPSTAATALAVPQANMAVASPAAPQADTAPPAPPAPQADTAPPAPPAPQADTASPAPPTPQAYTAPPAPPAPQADTSPPSPAAPRADALPAEPVTPQEAAAASGPAAEEAAAADSRRLPSLSLSSRDLDNFERLQRIRSRRVEAAKATSYSGGSSEASSEFPTLRESNFEGLCGYRQKAPLPLPPPPPARAAAARAQHALVAPQISNGGRRGSFSHRQPLASQSIKTEVEWIQAQAEAREQQQQRAELLHQQTQLHLEQQWKYQQKQTLHQDQQFPQQREVELALQKELGQLNQEQKQRFNTSEPTSRPTQRVRFSDEAVELEQLKERLRKQSKELRKLRHFRDQQHALHQETEQHLDTLHMELQKLAEENVSLLQEHKQLGIGAQKAALRLMLFQAMQQKKAENVREAAVSPRNEQTVALESVLQHNKELEKMQWQLRELRQRVAGSEVTRQQDQQRLRELQDNESRLKQENASLRQALSPIQDGHTNIPGEARKNGEIKGHSEAELEAQAEALAVERRAREEAEGQLRETLEVLQLLKDCLQEQKDQVALLEQELGVLKQQQQLALPSQSAAILDVLARETSDEEANNLHQRTVTTDTQTDRIPRKTLRHASTATEEVERAETGVQAGPPMPYGKSVPKGEEQHQQVIRQAAQQQQLIARLKAALATQAKTFSQDKAYYQQLVLQLQQRIAELERYQHQLLLHVQQQQQALLAHGGPSANQYQPPTYQAPSPFEASQAARAAAAAVLQQVTTSAAAVQKSAREAAERRQQQELREQATSLGEGGGEADTKTDTEDWLKLLADAVEDESDKQEAVPNTGERRATLRLSIDAAGSELTSVTAAADTEAKQTSKVIPDFQKPPDFAVSNSAIPAAFGRPPSPATVEGDPPSQPFAEQVQQVLIRQLQEKFEEKVQKHFEKLKDSLRGATECSASRPFEIPASGESFMPATRFQGAAGESADNTQSESVLPMRNVIEEDARKPDGQAYLAQQYNQVAEQRLLSLLQQHPPLRSTSSPAFVGPMGAMDPVPLSASASGDADMPRAQFRRQDFTRSPMTSTTASSVVADFSTEETQSGTPLVPSKTMKPDGAVDETDASGARQKVQQFRRLLRQQGVLD